MRRWSQSRYFTILLPSTVSHFSCINSSAFIACCIFVHLTENWINLNSLFIRRIAPKATAVLTLSSSTSAQLVLLWNRPDSSACNYTYSVSAYPASNPTGSVTQSVSGMSGATNFYVISTLSNQLEAIAVLCSYADRVAALHQLLREHYYNFDSARDAFLWNGPICGRSELLSNQSVRY